MSDERKPLRPGKDVARESVLHPDFKYVPSHETNLQATFARVRAELERAAASAPTPFRKRKVTA